MMEPTQQREITDFQKEWLRRLRDPNTRQGYSQLGYHDCRCAMGVACEIAVERGLISKSELGGGDCIRFAGNIYTAPGEVRMAAGIRDRDHSVIVSMNDTERRPFSEIADYIEKYVCVSSPAA